MKHSRHFTAGESQSEYLVFISWNGEPGGVSTFRTLEEAMLAVKAMQIAGYDKEKNPVRVFKETRERIR